MGADQKVELQPADPEEIRTGGDPTVTQEQINTTPDRLLGRRRILRIGLGAAILTAATAAFGKTAYDALTAAPAEATGPEVLKANFRDIKWGEPLKIIRPSNPQVKIATVDSPVEVSTKVINSSADTFVERCRKFSHPVKRYDVNLGTINNQWLIVYFPDIAGAEAEAFNPNFQDKVRYLTDNASVIPKHFFGFIEKNQITPLPIKLSKPSTSYSSGRDLAVELLDRKLFSPDNSGGFPNLNIVYVGNNDLYMKFGSSGGCAGTWGTLVLPADVAENYNKVWAIQNTAHEKGHEYGFAHDYDQNNFMFPMIATSTTTPQYFNRDQAISLSDGGRDYLPIDTNAFIPAA